MDAVPQTDAEPLAAPGETHAPQGKRGRGRPPGLKTLLTKIFPDGATLEQLRAEGYTGDPLQELYCDGRTVTLDDQTGVYRLVKPRRGRPPKGSTTPPEQSATKPGDVVEIRIDEIQIGERFRKEMGDLDELAASIDTEGLLQPIGITPNQELVFGQRRVEAYKKLGRDRIPARIVHVSSIANGEHDENELRKAFTHSERVAIWQAIGRKPLGDQSQSENFPTADEAAKRVGYGMSGTARDAAAVIEHGTPELKEAMDRGELAVSAAALVAKQPPETQRQMVKLPKPERKARVASLRDKPITALSPAEPITHVPPRESLNPQAADDRKAVRLEPWNRIEWKVRIAEAHWLKSDLAALREDLDEILNTPVLQ